MERTNFEKLRVYRLSEHLADRIWNVVKAWDYLAKDTVGKQIIRAADSIGANIAEGTGRGTLEDNRRFIRMARGSLYETRHWLRRALQAKATQSATGCRSKTDSQRAYAKTECLFSFGEYRCFIK